MTEEDVHRICESIERIMSHLNADIFEHVIGPYKEPESLAAGVHRVADSLDRIANAIEEATGFWAQPPPKQKSKSKKTKKRSSK